MARFLAEIEGSGQAVHRLGSPSSGIRAQAQGWDVGVSVQGEAQDDRDVFYVYATGGSNGHCSHRYLGCLVLVDGEPVWTPSGQPAELEPIASRRAALAA